MFRLPSPSPRVLLSAIAGSFVYASTACKDSSNEGPAPATRRRVDAVQAASTPKVDLAGFCDERLSVAEAKSFAMPPLADAAFHAPKTWQWVNVWATWCKPCVEELPLLRSWRGRLDRDGVPLEIIFLSVDDTAEAVDEFRSRHPQAPKSLRIADRERLGAWLETLGLGESTALPIHLFVDPAGKLRCVRLGQVGEGDYANVIALVHER